MYSGFIEVTSGFILEVASVLPLAFASVDPGRFSKLLVVIWNSRLVPSEGQTRFSSVVVAVVADAVVGVASPFWFIFPSELLCLTDSLASVPACVVCSFPGVAGGMLVPSLSISLLSSVVVAGSLIVVCGTGVELEVVFMFPPVVISESFGRASVVEASILPSGVACVEPSVFDGAGAVVGEVS